MVKERIEPHDECRCRPYAEPFQVVAFRSRTSNVWGFL